jgi:N-acetylneuraminate synthase
MYLERVKDIKDKKGIPVFLSTGMSDLGHVRKVIDFLGEDNIVLMHAVGNYPVKNEEVNLNVVRTYKREFKCPVGYSGHEVGLQITLAAIALGAKVIERHITMDRSMWGTDQAASIEPQGVIRLVRDIRVIEKSLGTGEKTLLEAELGVIKKLRKVNDFKI